MRGKTAVIFGRDHLVRLRHDVRSGLGRQILGDDRLTLANATLRSFREPRGALHDVGSDFIEDPELQRALGRNRRAFEHKFERGARADQTRQALRAAGARARGRA